LSSRDRWLLLALCAIVMALAALGSRSGGENAGDFRPTSYLNTPRGTRALFLALREMGIPVARRTVPFEARYAITGPVVLLAPGDEPSAAEWGRLLAYVRKGGTLLYVPRPWFGPAAADSLGLVLEPLRGDTSTRMGKLSLRPDTALAVPHPWTAGVAPIPGFRYAFSDTSRALRQPGARRLLRTREGHVTGVALAQGKGTVVALSDAEPLGNAQLRTGGTALLVARIAAQATGGKRTLAFDEYHHGYSDEASVTRALGHFLWRTRPGHAVLQLAAAALALLYLLGRRFGAPLPVPAAERRSPLEHVEALAGAYRQAGARATARRLVVAGLSRRLGRKPLRDAATGAGTGEDDLVERITARMPVAREAAQALDEEWKRGPQGDLVALTRNVDRLLDEVKRP
jgi:hypothetical protein